MLGFAQEEWLASALAQSRARGKIWQILGNQTVMARMHSPIVAVVADESPTASLIGAVSVAHLLEMLLPPTGAQPAP